MSKYFNINFKPNFHFFKSPKVILAIILALIGTMVISYFVAISKLEKALNAILIKYKNDDTGGMVVITDTTKPKIKGFIKTKIVIEEMRLNVFRTADVVLREVIFSSSLFSFNKIRLIHIGNISVKMNDANGKPTRFLLAYPNKPDLFFLVNRRGELSKLHYADNGYDIINEDSGTLYEQCEYLNIDYDTHQTKRLEGYDLIVNTLLHDIPLADNCPKCITLGEVGDTKIHFKISNEILSLNQKGRVEHKTHFNIDNLIFENQLFSLNGKGFTKSTFNSDDVPELEFIVNVYSYQHLIDYLFNIALRKTGKNIRQSDIIKYYVVISNKILPLLLAKQQKDSNIGSDDIRLKVIYNRKGEIEINNVTLATIITKLFLP